MTAEQALECISLLTQIRDILLQDLYCFELFIGFLCALLVLRILWWILSQFIRF